MPLIRARDDCHGWPWLAKHVKRRQTDEAEPKHRMTQPRLTVPVAAIAELCHQHRIRHLGLFGSVLRDDFRPDSDVDMLVEFEAEVQIGLFALVDIQDELAVLLGRPVDLVLREGLKPAIRASVLASEQVIYSA